MKNPQKLLPVFALLILAAALYRIIPGRSYGFEPMIAMAIFGGAVVKDKKWAFALPLFSMLLSDALYQGLHAAGLSTMAGFYQGQWLNYLLLAGITFIGIAMKRISVINIAAASLAAPVLYFLLSNGATWLGHGGYNYPMTGKGLFMTYTVAIPFFKMELLSSVMFSGVFFGSWYALRGTARTAGEILPA